MSNAVNGRITFALPATAGRLFRPERVGDLIFTEDDGIVVVEVNMSNDRLSASEYLTSAETTERRELLFGRVHEPPAPFFSHQLIVTRATVLLDEYVRRNQLGAVVVSPVDVILDFHKALVLQPDVTYIASERLSLAGNQINGAPDLAVEVESPGSQHYDRVTKLEMYQEYGVREYWLIDPIQQSVTVIDLTAATATTIARNVFAGDAVVSSNALPGFAVAARAFFE